MSELHTGITHPTRALYQQRRKRNHQKNKQIFSIPTTTILSNNSNSNTSNLDQTKQEPLDSRLNAPPPPSSLTLSSATTDVTTLTTLQHCFFFFSVSYFPTTQEKISFAHTHHTTLVLSFFLYLVLRSQPISSSPSPSPSHE